MTDVISFVDAIADSSEYSKKHLLLGNGFSIACMPNIFHYGSLYKQADFSQIPKAKQIFESLDTQDFELAIKALESAAKIAPIYSKNDRTIAKNMNADAGLLKDLLISTVAGNHPSIPMDIQDKKFWACRQFLSNFLGKDSTGYVFSLNYDLLLYWTLMHEDMTLDDPIELNTNDGFGNDEEDTYKDYVVWQGETNPHTTCVHFLHGALHLFDAGHELQKYTWVRRQEPLLEQARTAIDSNKFPLFVAEGTSQQKFSKIRHNAYLYQGLKVLATNAKQGKHCFFIYGHSLAENDNHILNLLGKGKFKKLYVSLYGDPDTNTNVNIIKMAERLKSLRPASHKPLEVIFYDAASANVWGET